MRRNRLGCLTGTGLIAGLITVLSIAGYAFISGGLMFNPGALNAVRGQPLGGVASHAEIAGECKACHAAPWEAHTMDERCVVCHTDVPAQMTDVSTSHGRMMKITPDAKCRDCHPEHHGVDAPLTVLEGWKYPHEASGFFLTGHQLTAAKEPFKCADCHGNDVTTFDVQVCATCHNQIDSAFMASHVSAYGTSCLGCHDGVDRFNKTFTHANFAFKLEGQHAPVTCEKIGRAHV